MKYGAYLFGCAGEAVTPWEAKFFGDSKPLGFILFARNIRTRHQLIRLCDDLRQAAGYQALIAIDQEGGRVQRMTPPQWRAWPPPLDQCTMTSSMDSTRAMWLRYRIIAEELRDVGIDTNCVPVVDIAGEDTHAVLKNRCYGYDPDSIIRHALAVTSANQDGGILSVVKHIPGQGRLGQDSHLQLPRTDATEDQLHRWDWRPLAALRHLPLGMTSHALFSSLDHHQPATWSREIIRLVRNKIGFEGLLMTDDISMSALWGSVGSRSRKALRAGCDVILHCNGDMREMEEIADECGQLTGAALVRAQEALAARQQPSNVDVGSLEREFQQLTGVAI